MKFKEIVSVSGKPGLKRIVSQRPDGLVISEMDGSGKKFLSNRIHMFTPLENIAIYTNDDSEPLIDVLINMKNKKEELPVVAPNVSAAELKKYMSAILPDYDEDRVFISDIKKLVKWFVILDDHDLIKKEEAKEESESSEEASTAEEE